MASLINDFCPTRFAGDVEDMLLSSADTVEFQLLKDGVLILKESYSPASGSIRVGGLSVVLETSLWGNLVSEGVQSNLMAEFQFKVDGQTLLTKTLIGSHQKNTLDAAGTNVVLSHGKSDVCYPDKPHPLTFAGAVTARLHKADGTQLSSRTMGSSASVQTFDCDPAALFSVTYPQGAYVDYISSGETFRSYIDHRRYADATLIRFLNMYDAPESVLVKQPIEVKPNFSDAVGTSYGTRNRYSINPTDEYTAVSGRLASMAEYLLWRDFSMSRKAEVLHEGEWYPIVVTKPNFTRLSGGDNLGEAKVSFQMAKGSLSI